jgi:hypothetical protein
VQSHADLVADIELAFALKPVSVDAGGFLNLVTMPSKKWANRLPLLFKTTASMSKSCGPVYARCQMLSYYVAAKTQGSCVAPVQISGSRHANVS